MLFYGMVGSLAWYLMRGAERGCRPDASADLPSLDRAAQLRHATLSTPRTRKAQHEALPSETSGTAAAPLAHCSAAFLSVNKLHLCPLHRSRFRDACHTCLRIYLLP